MTAPHDLLDRVGVLIESRVVRAALVVLIILSVLPYPAIEESLRPVFLLAFGSELLVRVPLLIRRRRRGDMGAGQLAFLLFDVAAFLSFLPLDRWIHPDFLWLTFIRLSRLLVLMRFARELASDIYSILTRREQLQQFGLVSVAVGALAFVSAVVLSQLGISHDYDGIPDAPEGFADRLWWSFRQLESGDNLVQNLHVHPLVGVLSLGLTITGVFIISFVIGIGTNIVEQVVRAERRRMVGYAGHTVVIGPIAKSPVLIREFVRIYSKNRLDRRDQLARLWRWLVHGGSAPRAWRLPRMALLGREAEPPAVLLEPGMRWVVYRQGEGTDAEALVRVGAGRAKRAILLGHRDAGEDADAVTLATLAAFRELNPDAHVFVELLSSRNHSTIRALGLGGARAFPLDLPWYLGLFLLHHLLVPGVERLYRFLLTAEGSELYTHIFADPTELEALARQADDDGFVAFDVLAAIAETFGVVLVGVMLGPRSHAARGIHDSISVDGLVPWVNPLTTPTDGRATALGARAGWVPLAHLWGLIAVADSYHPLRNLARALARGARPPLPILEPKEDQLSIVRPPVPPPQRILVVGYGDSVASLTARLAQLRDEARVMLVCSEGSLARVRTAMHLGAAPLSAGGCLEVELERGGRLEVRVATDADAMDAALGLLAIEPVDAVVFLAESDTADADARTALRLVRLAEHLLEGAPRSPPHVLAELRTLAKGERARAQIARAFGAAARPVPVVTLVSTEQIRHYFMVHSAFVPGIHEVYGGLLSASGPDILRLPLSAPTAMRMSEARLLMARRGQLALAFEREGGEVLLNPDPSVDCPDAVAIYAIGEAIEGPAEGLAAAPDRKFT